MVLSIPLQLVFLGETDTQLSLLLPPPAPPPPTTTTRFGLPYVGYWSYSAGSPRIMLHLTGNFFDICFAKD
jgi:hypothetical protein